MSGFFSGFDCGWKKFGDFEIKTNRIIAVKFTRPEQTGSEAWIPASVVVLFGTQSIILEDQAHDDFKEWWEGEKANEDVKGS